MPWQLLQGGAQLDPLMAFSDGLYHGSLFEGALEAAAEADQCPAEDLIGKMRRDVAKSNCLDSGAS